MKESLLSRRDSAFQRLDLRPFFAELQQSAREKLAGNITFDFFLPADLWPARSSASCVRQLLLALCATVAATMPEGGKLCLVADNVELGRADSGIIAGGYAGQFVCLLVSGAQTGFGNEPVPLTRQETLERMLSVMDGFMRVQNELGQGTTIEVFLRRESP
jgi:hypothetical protein